MYLEGNILLLPKPLVHGEKMVRIFLHVRNWFSDLIVNFKQLFEPLRKIKESSSYLIHACCNINILNKNRLFISWLKWLKKRLILVKDLSFLQVLGKYVLRSLKYGWMASLGRVDMSLSKPGVRVRDKEAWCAAVHWVQKSWTQPSNWKITKGASESEKEDHNREALKVDVSHCVRLCKSHGL